VLPYRPSALPYRLAVFGRAVPHSSISVYLVPECQRLHGIIQCVVSADKMTVTPSEMISSSINDLPVWYCERASISYRSRLLGPPGHHRIYHNLHYYSNRKSAFPLILFCPTADSSLIAKLYPGDSLYDLPAIDNGISLQYRPRASRNMAVTSNG
jgi:hypothetical protein